MSGPLGFLVRISSGGVGSSTRRGGAQKVRHVLQNPWRPHFWQDIPDFCRDVPCPRAPEKLRKQIVRNSRSLMLRSSWRPSKEVPKPRPGKLPKRCVGKCQTETAGCRGKCRKKCSGFAEPSPEHFFRHFLRHPVSGRHFPKPFCRHFSRSGLQHFRGLPGS